MLFFAGSKKSLYFRNSMELFFLPYSQPTFRKELGYGTLHY